MKWLLALLAAGCGQDLPPASFIDKLRVLAVQAEPPEVEPGMPTRLRRLAVEPRVVRAQDDAGAVAPLSTLWLACLQPPGVTSPLPCGVGPGVTPTVPPACSDAPGAPVCVIGEEAEVTYRPDRSALGSDGTGQVLLTVVVADTVDGARGCLLGIAFNQGIPTEPDRCVVSLKRLVVSDPHRAPEKGQGAVPPANQNPHLESFVLRDPAGAERSLTTPHWPSHASFVAAKDAPAMTLVVRRTEESAERAGDGNYEALTISWFTNGGKIDGGRSALDPPGCSSQLECLTKLPSVEATTSWKPPTPDALASMNPSGVLDYWAVIRDDRGGVDWQHGTARAR